MIKALIFDCFGVLTQDGWLAFLDKYETTENSDQLHDLNHQEDRGLISYDQFLDSIIELTSASREESHRMITTELHPNQRLITLIKQLKGGHKLGIISNVGQPLSVYLPNTVLGLFDEITTSSEIGVLKPQPEIYLHHLKKLGVEPSEAIFIDDRGVNVAGSEAIGMHGIFFQDVERLKIQLNILGILE